MNLEVSEKSRVIAWFSCGAASAVATKLALDEFPGCIPVYCDTGAEHEDNKRFLKDCEKWFGKEILVLRSKRYKDIWDVFERMAKVERKLDVAICKTEAGGKRQRLFLDELPEDQGRYEPLPDMSCGLLCGE
jgi:3'-phosphoadenosine 5'-phosphosulfate sulfotransferase (PAPS reductase)/FAD synthetase